MSLSVRGLSVSYGQEKVLKNLSISALAPGSVTGLLGPNAAGKSTLFKAIAGLLTCEITEMTLNKSSITSMSGKVRAKNIAYLPQSFHSHIALSVFESVLLALKQQSKWRVKDDDLDKVSETLARLNIEKLADKDIYELSGGQKQLVAMARILVISPKVILLDEPTSALDLHHQLTILDVVRSLTRDRNIITIAALHDVNLAAKFCDQLMLLNQGVIQMEGKPEEVLAAPLLGEIYNVSAQLERASRGGLYVDANLALSA
jgi:iron complex transport system ATP-binding protein